MKLDWAACNHRLQKWGDLFYHGMIITDRTGQKNQKEFGGSLKWLVGYYMLATACPKGRLKNWPSLHPEKKKVEKK